MHQDNHTCEELDGKQQINTNSLEKIKIPDNRYPIVKIQTKEGGKRIQ